LGVRQGCRGRPKNRRHGSNLRIAGDNRAQRLDVDERDPGIPHFQLAQQNSQSFLLPDDDSPFMTKIACSRAVMFSSRFPGTAMISASLPGSRVPSQVLWSLELRNVAGRRADDGDLRHPLLGVPSNTSRPAWPRVLPRTGSYMSDPDAIGTPNSRARWRRRRLPSRMRRIAKC
jgi:hypothetical protein